ncbi:MAG: hypothetical protein JJU29_21450 [Verrucomicrobia bacterium]|nr:hypothetical protein [Verrucomicrobiota bacterium]MCH8511611.1 hypothetical protein [Kiritimatiellia bacterium]
MKISKNIFILMLMALMFSVMILVFVQILYVDSPVDVNEELSDWVYARYRTHDFSVQQMDLAGADEHLEFSVLILPNMRSDLLSLPDFRLHDKIILVKDRENIKIFELSKNEFIQLYAGLIEQEDAAPCAEWSKALADQIPSLLNMHLVDENLRFSDIFEEFERKNSADHASLHRKSMEDFLKGYVTTLIDQNVDQNADGVKTFYFLDVRYKSVNLFLFELKIDCTVFPYGVEFKFVGFLFGHV